jgi:3-oxoacyl-[acyl-carrier-protein] synthase-3
VTRAGLGVAIGAIAHVLPERVMTNQAIIDAYGLRLTDRWVRENIGIHERRWCSPGQTASTMAADVCRMLVARAGIDVSAIDRLIIATVSPDQPTPSTACVVQSRFAPGQTFACMDVVAACGGFLYALDLGRRCVQTGDENVLVVASEVRSAFLDKKDRRTVMLFGDGAAGVLLRPSREGEVGIIDTRVFADGRYWDAISVPAGGVNKPTSEATLAAGEHTIVMKDGAAIFDRAIVEMQALVTRTLEAAGITHEDVGFFAFHQASLSIVRKVQANLGIPDAKVGIAFDRLGNVTAASVPIVLAEAVEQGRIVPGMLVCAVATGGGFTAGRALFRYEAP